MASRAAMIRSAGRNVRAANKAATTTARGCRPSCRSHRQRGRWRRSSWTGHRARTLPFRVSKVLPPFCVGVASGADAEEPSTSLRLGPAGARVCACCATAQTFLSMASVFLWPALSWSPICGGIPHLVALVSIYLIILISDWPEFPISLQDSSGGACRSLAVLISLPRFSASSRKGTNPFMQASDGPPDGGAGPRSNAEPVTGAAPVDGKADGEAPMAALGVAPLTGGNAGSLGWTA